MIKRLFTYLYGNIRWNLKNLWRLHKKDRSSKRLARKLRKAKKMAMRLHGIDGRRYYVLPDANGDLAVLNNTHVLELKKRGIMAKQVCIADLLRDALFFTPSGINYKKR